MKLNGMRHVTSAADIVTANGVSAARTTTAAASDRMCFFMTSSLPLELFAALDACAGYVPCVTARVVAQKRRFDPGVGVFAQTAVSIATAVWYFTQRTESCGGGATRRASMPETPPSRDTSRPTAAPVNPTSMPSGARKRSEG